MTEPRYKAILAKDDDIPEIMDSARHFFNRSHLAPFTTIDAHAADLLDACMKSPDFACMLSVNASGDIGGYALLIRDKEFFSGYLGAVHQFYVHPEHRGASRALSQACGPFFDQWDCFGSQAADTTGLGSKLLDVMWTKAGYKKIGSVWFRAKDGKEWAAAV